MAVSVFQCFNMRSRVSPRVILGCQAGGFLAQSGSRSVQQRAGMRPVNRTIHTNQLSACGIFMHYIQVLFFNMSTFVMVDFQNINSLKSPHFILWI